MDIERGFGVNEDSVHCYYKKFKEKGESGFFGEDARKGKSHKIVGERRIRIQQKLDKGQSVLSIAKEEGVRESAIWYQIKQGNFKKKVPPLTESELPTTLGERNQSDQSAPLGIATTRYEERIASSLGQSSHAPIRFEHNEGLCGAGVLFLLPALIEQGLLRTKEVYRYSRGSLPSG